jgi:hypothetical protein
VILVMHEYQLPHNLLYASIEAPYTGSRYDPDEDDEDDDRCDYPRILYVFSAGIQTVKYEKQSSSPENFYEDFCLECNWKPHMCAGGYERFRTGNCPASVRLSKVEFVVPIDMPMHCFVIKSGSECIYTHYFWEDKIYPLQISNVYFEGRWCAGNLDFNGCEMDITGIYTRYWETLRNGDLPVTEESYTDHIESISRDFQYLPDLQDRKLDIGRTHRCGFATNSHEHFHPCDDTLTYHKPKMLTTSEHRFAGSVRVGNNEYIRFN